MTCENIDDRGGIVDLIVRVLCNLYIFTACSQNYHDLVITEISVLCLPFKDIRRNILILQ